MNKNFLIANQKMLSNVDIVKNSYYCFDGNEDEKCVEIICEFFLKRICSKESFDYLLSVENFRMVGCCYWFGRGVEQDYKKAYEYYKKANETENVYALKSIGDCYYEGKGVEQDYKKAYECYKIASEFEEPQGRAYALVQIGHCYYDGQGVEQDFKKAYEYFSKAGEMGNTIALVNIGVCYCHGQGVEQDCKKAYECFKKASELGSVEALLCIGYCYREGKGVEKDDRKAYDYFKQASELENIEASEQLLEFTKEQVEKFEMELELKRMKEQISTLFEKLQEVQDMFLYAPPSLPNGGIGFQKAKKDFETLSNKQS